MCSALKEHVSFIFMVEVKVLSNPPQVYMVFEPRSGLNFILCYKDSQFYISVFEDWRVLAVW